MNPQKNEKISKYFRFSHTVRVIALTLLISLSSSQIHNCYASLNNIEYNTSQTATNTANINTKMGNIYTALSTLYSYLSNNGNGVREVLGYIYNYEVSSNTYLYNMWTTMNNATYGLLAQGLKLNDIETDVLAVGGQVADVSSKLLTSNGYLNSISSNTYNTLNELKYLNWVQENITYGYYPSIADAVAKTNSCSQGSYSNVYVRFDFDNDIYNKALKLVFGVIPYSPLNVVNTDAYIDCIYMVNNSNNGAVIVDDNIHRLYYNSSQRTSSFYLDGTGRTMSSGGNSTALRSLIIRISGTQNSYVFPNQSSLAYSLPFDSEDYYKLANYINLSNLSTDDIVEALQDLNVNVEIDDSINITPINLDVQIGIDDFTEVNTISNKLRTWLSTGVGVSALIGALDQLDDSFFTLHNRNVIETINSGYTDFYD